MDDKRREPTMALADVRAGVVDAVTPDGRRTLWLSLELAGTIDGQDALLRVAIHPRNLPGFLAEVNGASARHFGDLPLTWTLSDG